GFIATANHNVQPKGFSPPIMFKTAPTPYDRIVRLLQLIQPGKKYTLEDHARWQHDAHSLRAAADLPRFRGWTSADPAVEFARSEIAKWDAVYARESRAAAIYEAWRSGGGGRGGRGAGSGRGTAPAEPTREQVEARLK